MEYVGWKIFAYRYYHDQPGLQRRISKQELLERIKQCFDDPNWSIEDDKGHVLLTHPQTKSEIRVEIHGEDIPIEYDDGLEKETYLVTLRSNTLGWKRAITDNKQLMNEVWRRLPWGKVACHLLDGSFLLVRADSIDRGFEPFEVVPEKWKECPIPDKPKRVRLRRRLRLARPTSYLGTRIRIPRKRQTKRGETDDFPGTSESSK